MMAKLITGGNLKELLLELQRDFKVVAPVTQNHGSATEQISFEEIGPKKKIILSYPTTVLPPKEYFLPPEEVLFEIKDGKAKKPAAPEETILFGLNAEDLEGVAKLKDIFNRPIKDLIFTEKAKSVFIFGLDRVSPPNPEYYDLYFMKVSPDLYAAFATTKFGQKVIKNPRFVEKNIKIPSVKKSTDELLENKDLPKILENARNHPVWKELAEICFGCGICSYVCPLCYCFETEDKVNIGQNSGQRCRSWDSCMLEHFAETNAGNFRPALEDRIYNWYFHKFVRFPAEYGYPGCIDCSRCVIYCPAKISYRKVLSRLVKEAK